jgi:hypothetical protein
MDSSAGNEQNNTESTAKIFWSWQSDHSPKTCRTFIRAALVEAIDILNRELDVDDADRPEIDHDTKDERGMVDIASTILGKIARSAVFVADLTPIGRSQGGKWLPNPNVMIELGWAMQRPGWERVIGVLNTASGAEIEDLPFDIRQRRVITYVLADDADPNTRKSVHKKLVNDLKAALEINLTERAEQLATDTPIRGVPAKADNPSIWASAKDTLIHNEAFGGAGRSEIALPDVPRSYMRIIPSGWKSHAPSVADIAGLSQALQVHAPSDGMASGDFGATEEGFVSYWFSGGRHGERRASINVAMFFEDTGEFWMLHGTAIGQTNGYDMLRDHAMVGQWSRMLRRAMQVMDHFGAREARRVEAGLFNVRDLRWYAQWEGDRTQSRRNDVHLIRQSRDWDSAAQLTYLTDAYNRVRSLFARQRSTEAEVSDILRSFDPERFRDVA